MKNEISSTNKIKREMIKGLRKYICQISQNILLKMKLTLLFY